MTLKTKEFLDALERNPGAQEFVKNGTRPETADEVLKAYSALAESMGYNLSEEELKVVLEEEGKSLAGRTEAAASVIEKLPDETLGMVAGGQKDHPECKDTYQDKENCWFTDGCDIINNHYDGYLCKRSNKGACMAPANCKWDNYSG